MFNTSRIKLYGPPTLEDAEGRPVKLRTNKQLAVVVYLALHRESNGSKRSTLADLLWRDVSESRGRHSLSQGLSAIRQGLGDDVLESQGERIWLTDRIRSELDRWPETGVQAQDLISPLQGMENVGGVDFSHWLDGARERLIRTARAQTIHLFHESRRQGLTKRVHEIAIHLHTLDPLNDLAVQTLAERALLDGNIPKAITLVRDFLTRADGQIPETSLTAMARLAQRIESGVHPPVDVVPNAVRDRDEAGAGYFLGREEDLSRLESVWEQTREGTFHGCLVSGLGGIGKSSLVARFATSVTARGQLALTVRCQEVGKGVPFAALADLVHGLAQDPALGSTDPHWLAEASRIAPGLRERFPGLPKPDQAPAESMKLRLAEAFFQILHTVTEDEAFLVVIDDVQHIDPASRDVLHVLSRRLNDVPAMLLAAVRTDDVMPSTSLDREHVGFAEWHESLNLKPLTPAHATTLVDRIATDLKDHARYTIIRNTVLQFGMGNPYYLEVLVADWRTHEDDSLVVAQTAGHVTSAKWSPPDAMRRIFSRHYEGLSRECRQLMEVLAVAGRALDTTELGTFLNTPPGAVTRLVLDIMERGALRLEGEAVSFRNDLHSAFVYFAMAEETRGFHHATLAKALLETESSGDAIRLLEVSHHFAKATMGSQAMEHALTGADAAVMSGAPKEAEHAIREAMALVEQAPAEATIILCAALNKQGRFAETLSIIAEQEGANPQTPTTGQLAVIQAEAMVRGRLGEDSEIRLVVTKTMEDPTTDGEDFRFANAFQIAAEFAADRGDANALKEAEERANELAESEGRTVVAAQAHMTLGFCAWTSGRFADGYRYFAASSKVLEAKNHSDAARALNGKAICAWAVGDFGLALELYEHAIFYANRIGNYPLASNIYNNKGTLLLDLGRRSEADLSVQRALALDKKSQNNRYSSAILETKSLLSIMNEDWDQAAMHLDNAEQQANERKSPKMLAAIHFIRADLHLAEQNLPQAIESIQKGEFLLKNSPAIPAYGYQASAVRLRAFLDWQNNCFQLPDDGKMRCEYRKMQLTLTGVVELNAFTEWIATTKLEQPHPAPETRELISCTGLFGIARLMELVGLLPYEQSAHKIPNTF